MLAISVRQRSPLLLFFLLLLCSCHAASAWSRAERLEMRDRVHEMVHHAFESYMTYAFPHDELKSLSGTYTDSLGELGNASPNNAEYRGVAMTLIDSLDTLAIVGNHAAFARGVRWVGTNVSFDIDLRVNVFETNIRLLGGLLSAHLLASDPSLNLMNSDTDAPGCRGTDEATRNYDGCLLTLALDLGRRLLPAFENEVTQREGAGKGLPYAWVNLKHGLVDGEVTETCSAVAGTLLLEFGLLSHLSGERRFFDAAHASLMSVWNLRSERDLVGNTLDVVSRAWTNTNAGIGSGIDSFYEYLFKAYILFGDKQYLDMYNRAAAAVAKYLKKGPWYIEADMHTGLPTHLHFNSLQAFYPGLQVQSGAIAEAAGTQAAFFSLWSRFRALPERFVLPASQLHPSLNYYPLRPELAESAYFLYQATKHPKYLDMGRDIYWALQNVTRVEKGYASVKDVSTGQLEDHMSSFFLAETCKYLALLFDEENFVHSGSRNYVFSTEGHLFPLTYDLHRAFSTPTEPSATAPPTASSEPPKRGGRSCPVMPLVTWADYAFASPDSAPEADPFAAAATAQARLVAAASQCPIPAANEPPSLERDLEATVGEGAFTLRRRQTGEMLYIRNLGTEFIEFVNFRPPATIGVYMLDSHSVTQYWLVSECFGRVEATGAFFTSAPHFEVSGELFAPANLHGCYELTGDEVEFVRGRIAIVDRGQCTFMEKVERLHRAGAAAVVIVNSLEAANVFMMGGDGSNRLMPLPALMVTRQAGILLRSCASMHPRLVAHTEAESRPAPSLLNADTSTVTAAGREVGPRGTPSQMQFTALGGWTVLVQERDKVFHLHLVP